MIDPTFRTAEKLVGSNHAELVGDISKVAGVLLLISALLTGSPVPLAAASIASAAEALEIKNELTGAIRRTLTKITAKRDHDPIKLYERMAAAYALVCYSAFFETLDQIDALAQIKKAARINPAERIRLTNAALDRLSTPGDAGPAFSHQAQTLGPLDTPLRMPHPADTFTTLHERLQPLYQTMAREYLAFLAALSPWDALNDIQRNKIKELVDKVPEKAVARFDAQYYALSAKYEEFAAWAHLHEQRNTAHSLRRIRSDVSKYLEVATENRTIMDTGFQVLAQTISSIPQQVTAHKAGSVLSILHAKYASAIREPIIRDRTAAGTPALHYPSKEEIFLPQAFKLLHYTGDEALARESTWAALDPQEDLAGFLLSYFSSPYSWDTPLLILGHPGSGKSLLTHMLAARFATSEYTPIRIELRNVNADNTIAAQIEQQVRNDASKSIEWGDLAEYEASPPYLLIFDGYDELLQASGRVFAKYVSQVSEFQRSERHAHRRPLRAIITSRLALIDKAYIPTDREVPGGTTVLRLLEFDEPRRTKWARIWNQRNKEYFNARNIRPFRLPTTAGEVLLLAGQPLLLLMLAIYDSQDNQLHAKGEISRTALYNRLLRLFITRELEKAPDFGELNLDRREERVDHELERLGVAAIGMFNRRALSIHESELDRDLASFGMQRTDELAHGVQMTGGQLLVGSFFFVQESSPGRVAWPGAHSGDVAYEFLHTTFGEFLAAEFVVRRVMARTRVISQSAGDASLRREVERGLEGEYEFYPPDWFACLMYTELPSRPVILSMIREWVLESGQGAPGGVEGVRLGMERIAISELRRLLIRSAVPAAMMGDKFVGYPALPLLGHMAVYSLNVVLLASLAAGGEFGVEEDLLSDGTDHARGWDRVVALWRSWFSADTLYGLSAVMFTRRSEGCVSVRVRPGDERGALVGRVVNVRDGARAVGDDWISGLAGLLLYDGCSLGGPTLDEIVERLAPVDLELAAQVAVKQIGEPGPAYGPTHARDVPQVTRDLLRALAEPTWGQGMSIGSGLALVTEVGWVGRLLGSEGLRYEAALALSRTEYIPHRISNRGLSVRDLPGVAKFLRAVRSLSYYDFSQYVVESYDRWLDEGGNENYLVDFAVLFELCGLALDTWTLVPNIVDNCLAVLSVEDAGVQVPAAVRAALGTYASRLCRMLGRDADVERVYRDHLRPMIVWAVGEGSRGRRMGEGVLGRLPKVLGDELVGECLRTSRELGDSEARLLLCGGVDMGAVVDLQGRDALGGVPVGVLVETVLVAVDAGGWVVAGELLDECMARIGDGISELPSYLSGLLKDASTAVAAWRESQAAEG